MNERNDTFHYTYSAEQQEEIKRIRDKYEAPAEAEDKMAYLRRLDGRATRKAQARSIALGVIGALILGTGMSLAMTELGAAAGAFALILGILVGIAGMVLVALAYPVYLRILKTERQRIAPEILRLTDELLK